ncbi:thermostable hemolysin [Pseudoalteromonas fenneropenaei]|uniref:Thermostable hemolysin n=1 Tax=Pseudoalteromonas fenneropenaei TaxID=1737459 RepID=A0ABV7CFX1_9GAMM
MLAMTQLMPEQSGNYVCAAPNDVCRPLLEQEVREGFAKAFNADIHEFYPLLSHLATAQGVCVLGLRLAIHEALFVEQYLDDAIENLLAPGTLRSAIAELGNLCSSHRSATIAHFIVVANALLANNIRYLAFTGTAQVRKLMALLQVPVLELGHADPARVPSSNDYGSYYEAEPKTCVVDLQAAHATIANVALFSKLAAEYQAQADALTQGLKA